MSLTFVGALYLFYRYRINQILQIQRVRNRIARDLHDDIGATLGSISMYSQVAINRLGQGKENAAEVMEKIGVSSRQMIEKMGDIVWSVNPENDSLVNIIARMRSFAAGTLTEQDIQLSFNDQHFQKDIRLTMQQRQNLYLIFKEAIHNIIKYASCKSVTIHIEYTSGFIQLTIRDDGNGFDPAVTNAFNGNGLKNMKTRTGEINGLFSLESSPGHGTMITVRFPA
jgi:signal transduction histidine kinase